MHDIRYLTKHILPHIKQTSYILPGVIRVIRGNRVIGGIRVTRGIGVVEIIRLIRVFRLLKRYCIHFIHLPKVVVFTRPK